MYTHKASDPSTDGWEPPCSCWELNSEPWKNSQRSKSLSQLSSPQNYFLKKCLLTAKLVDYWPSDPFMTNVLEIEKEA